MSKKTIGVDVFVDYRGDVPELAGRLTAVAGPFTLQTISARGVKAWPDGRLLTTGIDHFAARFMSAGEASHGEIAALLARIGEAGIDFIKTENLCTFDGEAGFSLSQGQ